MESESSFSSDDEILCKPRSKGRKINLVEAYLADLTETCSNSDSDTESSATTAMLQDLGFKAVSSSDNLATADKNFISDHLDYMVDFAKHHLTSKSFPL